MVVKVKLAASLIHGTGDDRRRQIVQAEERRLGPCARLLEFDGMSLLRDDTEHYALHFDVPSDPAFLLL